ncbi:MAG TPA: winged helix-turn-helix transcriptional regulator [Thermoplasmatales archaeon]|nr:winged helix-turn-helix transcriptional regulator [Thermoplasmatales archaeon]
MNEKASAVYQILKVLRTNVLKILIVLREEDNLKWKEIQEKTNLPTATLNRSLVALRDIHFIDKEEGYKLTWAGKLAIDGLFLLGLKIGKYPNKEKIEDIVAEKILAQNIVLAVLVIILASVKVRGHLNIDELEKRIEDEKEVIYQILEEYSKEGYLEIKEGTIYATKKFENMGLDQIFSM